MGSVGRAGASGSALPSGGAGAAGSGASAGRSGANPRAGSGAAAVGGSAAGAGGTGLAAGAGGATAPPPGSAPLEPASGALLGVFYGADSLAATASKLGRTPPVHLVYYAWDDDWARGSKADLDAGRIPLVNWEPYDPSLDDIISGVYDTMIQKRAADAKNLGKPFFLDWGAEMNGDWSPWSGAQNGSNADKYLAAYKHIHDLFRTAGANNVVWLWCPNVTDEPRATWNQALNYYPGDDYVDWTCVDGYNWGSSGGGGGWQSFKQVFAGIYSKLATKNKPIMIGEMASAEVGGDKAGWIDEIVPTLRSTYPLIKGLVWFDINKETDWRIGSTPAAEAAFKRLATDAYFNP
jgi:hypothetical protein